MTKVYRLFQDRDLQDWEDRGEPYGPSVIEDIENPDGDLSKKAPTSIPSPFARIDLTRSAFKYIVDKNDFTGNTIYHQLVSDCLDVAQLFFNIDTLGDRAQIKVWDKNIDLQNLIESNNPKHQLLGETLDLFLKQDAKSNNFDSLNKMYFLLYDNKIVGGTSPISLFFTSANDLSFVKVNFGNDITFDKNLCPLYERDAEFQKYIYTFFYAHPELFTKMKNIADYLEQSLKQLDHYNNKLYKEIKTIEDTKTQDLLEILNDEAIYKALDTGSANDNVMILNFPLKKKKIGNRSDIIEQNSQFLINSSKPVTLPPLVLQNKFSEPLIYTDTNVQWNSSWEVPYYNETPIIERTLPNQLDRYPYVTVSDFLQPYLIKIPFTLNSKKYFNGNTKYESGDKNSSYLLPLTASFFDYFSAEDLKNNPNMIEMKVYANSVVVNLRIPIKGNQNIKHITFSRTYQNSGIAGNIPDLLNNKGFIMDNKVSLAIHPFEKMNENNAHYRVMFLDKNRKETLHYKYNLSFYSNNSKQPVVSNKKSRTNKENNVIGTDFYLIESNFDYINLEQNNANGIIIPLLNNKKGTKKLKFAVDFGTTNTHIEYKVEDIGPIPFEISNEDIQYETLHTNFKDSNTINDNLNDALEDINEYLRHEFHPSIIGGNSEFKFPIRTVTGESGTLDYNTTPDALADINIPFDYEKYASKRNTVVTPNLKWSDFDKEKSNNKDRVKCFIETIVLLIRAKVLASGGNLESTEVVWFYPSSMEQLKIESLEKIWDTFYKKYINSGKTKKISESIAPFYFYKKHRNVLDADKPVVSIDIGGGTSDIVVFSKNDPILISSSRYAANSIFGDGYGGSSEINGFIIKYKDIINDLISKNNLDEIQRAFNQISKTNKSEDIIAFYFSLANNAEVKRKKIPLIFDEKLAEDNDLKIVFIVFFSSIIYHLAKLMHSKNLSYPENILFSGTGSKVILITSGSDNLEKLNKMTTLIFEKVYNTTITREIELKIESEPKEVTCKGGLEIDTDIKDFESIKEILIGDEKGTTNKEAKLLYKDLSSKNELLESIKKENENFIDLLFDLNNDLNFKNYFGINSNDFETYKKLLKQDIMKFLKSGISQKEKANSDDIDESLFFYPLVGALNNLAYKIANKQKE